MYNLIEYSSNYSETNYYEYFEDINENKYLTLVPNNESKEIKNMKT